MSDQDPIVIDVETEETAPEPSRFKNFLQTKVAPLTPIIVTAVVVGIGSVMIAKSLTELENEDEIEETDVIVIDAPAETE